MTPLAATALDLHVHTTYGSLDSTMSGTQLVEAIRGRGLHGAVIAEHSTQWPPERATALAAESGLLLIPAREWHSQYGHILVLGLEHAAQQGGGPVLRSMLDTALGTGAGAPFSRSVREMRRFVDDCGGVMILAHPFRYFPGPRNLLFGQRPDTWTWPPARLAEHPAFSLVHEIEALNGDCSPPENALALVVARQLGMRGTGGSDAHAPHEVGHCITVFERPLASGDDLLREVHAGRFCAVRRDA